MFDTTIMRKILFQPCQKELMLAIQEAKDTFISNRDKVLLETKSLEHLNSVSACFSPVLQSEMYHEIVDKLAVCRQSHTDSLQTLSSFTTAFELRISLSHSALEFVRSLLCELENSQEAVTDTEKSSTTTTINENLSAVFAKESSYDFTTITTDESFSTTTTNNEKFSSIITTTDDEFIPSIIHKSDPQMMIF